MGNLYALGLIVLILSIPFATAGFSGITFEPVDQCTIDCWDDEGCDEEKCESLGCMLCDPLTCAVECNENQGEGETCNKDSQCVEGLHCSGGARAVSYQKACCFINYEWDYLKQQCVDGNNDFEVLNNNGNQNNINVRTVEVESESDIKDENDLSSLEEACVSSDEICDGIDNDCDEVIDEGCILYNGGCEKCSSLLSGWTKFCTEDECNSLSNEVDCVFDDTFGLNDCVSEEITIEEEVIGYYIIDDTEPTKTLELGITSTVGGIMVVVVGGITMFFAGASAVVAVGGALILGAGVVSLAVGFLAIFTSPKIDGKEEDIFYYETLTMAEELGRVTGASGYSGATIVGLEHDEALEFAENLNAYEDQATSFLVPTKLPDNKNWEVLTWINKITKSIIKTESKNELKDDKHTSYYDINEMESEE